MMRLAAALVTAALLVAGCSSDDTSPSDSTSAAVTLHDSCPQVEAALPEGMLPSAAKWETFATELNDLASNGDTETQNALASLQDAVNDLAADPPAGPKYLDAHGALLTALDNLAARCKAVGSSALQ